MMGFTIWDKKAVRICCATLFWLAIWEIVSLFAPKALFASPFATLRALLTLAQQGEFWRSIATTLLKTVLGFLLAFLSANLLAVASYRFLWVRTLLQPAVQLMKSAPVACFVIVALIWMTSAWIPLVVSSFVVFPIAYQNLLSALTQMSRSLEEMTQVFHVPLARKIRSVYLPQLMPSMLSTCRITVGMCWKASIAGEIIGLPLHSVGEQLYLSKLYLNMDDLFAWTAVIIAISALFENGAVWLLRRMRKKEQNEYE